MAAPGLHPGTAVTIEFNRWSDLLAKVGTVFANIAIVAALRTPEQVLDDEVVGLG